jgi:hypothetical protein
MQLKISKEKLKEPEKFIRRCGYGRIFDKKRNEVSYVRRFSGYFYPRFHVYINDGGKEWIFNLHLDQKRPIYPGVTAHGGEYEGKVVEEEIRRLEKMFQNYSN